MQSYKQKVSGTARALSYLMKRLDRDGIELLFTSEPNAKHVCKNSTEVETLINRRFGDGSSAGCTMELTLDKILEGMRKQLQKPAQGLSRRPSFGRPKATSVSIFVLTNGVWDSSADGTCGVERPIEAFVAYMKKNDIARTRATIQFVSFGSDERGIKRLDTLGNKLTEACQGL